MNEKELEHSGIKGMKWGVRHGPPYPLTAKQMSPTQRKKNPKLVKMRGNIPTAEEMAAKRKQIEEKTNKVLKKATDPSTVKLIEETGKAATAASNALKPKPGGPTYRPNRNPDPKPANMHEDSRRAHEKVDVRTLSDAELQRRLNRINMEDRYNDYTREPEKVSRGREVAKTTLAVIGTVATTAASVLSAVELARKVLH